MHTNDALSRAQKRTRTGLIGLVGLAVLGSTSLGWLVPAQAADDITRTPWQMYIEDTPHGKPSNGYDGNGRNLANSGDPKYYVDAKVPQQTDGKWQSAPDPDLIKFDGSVDPKRGGENGSRLSQNDCMSTVDYTYFQTVVTVPPGRTVKTFSVDFSKIDDGARISIYNAKNPNGVIVDSSYVKTGENKGTGNLNAYLGEGDNRVVITQLDNCAPGNNLGEARIVLDGDPVPAPDPTPAQTPAETPAATPAQTPAATPAETPAATPEQTPGASATPDDRLPITPVTYGDVHIRTPDGLKYDFQVAGDYTLLQDDTKNVLIQARQEFWVKNPKVSVNTAAALNVAGDRLEFYALPTYSYELNNVKTDVPTAGEFTLPKGGKVTVTQPKAGRTELIIMWPDGSFGAQVILTGGATLDVGVARFSGTTKFEGILGNLDKDPMNDVVLKGGETLTPPVAFPDLVKFGDSWRVPAEESMFGDALPAAETKNPTEEHQVTDLDQAATDKAKQACAAGGVTDALALEDCVYDVANTGDTKTFVETAATVQEATQALPQEERKTVSASTGQVLNQVQGVASSNLMMNPLVWVGAGVLLLLVIIIAIVAARRRGNKGGPATGAAAG